MSTQQNVNGTSAFEQARQLVTSCLDRLPADQRFEVGLYRYDGGWLSFNFSRGEHYVVIAFFPGGVRKPEHLSSIGYLGEYQNRKGMWSLTSHEIEFHTRDVPGEPIFSFRWDDDGILRFLSIDHQRASGRYMRLPGEPLEASQSRDLNRGDFPVMIEEGTREIGGVLIPWQIDFAAEAERILRESELEQFAEAALQQPPRRVRG